LIGCIDLTDLLLIKIAVNRSFFVFSGMTRLHCGNTSEKEFKEYGELVD
jgi:hypothetical protein